MNGQDVGNNSLTGADIRDRSGVDTCQAPLTAQFGPICAGSDGAARTWNNALGYCAGFGLRLPSLSEAVSLAKNYDVPGGDNSSFWTEETYMIPTPSGGDLVAYTVWDGVPDDGHIGVNDQAGTERTVCVTEPSA